MRDDISSEDKPTVSISVLGCGWLGLPLAERLAQIGFEVKGSSTSASKLDKIASVGAKPYLINIKNLSVEISGKPNTISDISYFLRSDILIINTPTMDIRDFGRLIGQIEKSKIKKLIFVSSTSVYPDNDEVMMEGLDLSSNAHPLLQIEDLFRKSTCFKTTIVRFSGLMGYDRQPGRFFPEGRLIPDPDKRVNMIHRDDCVGIIEQIIAQNSWGEIFNGSADTHPTRREFFTNAALDIGAAPPQFDRTETEGSIASGIKMIGKIISNEKVRSRLNYKFKYPDVLIRD